MEIAAKKGRKLSARMLEVLGHAEAGRPLETGCRTQAEYGGLSGTLYALRNRGLLRGQGITDAGRAALADARKA